jgi:hypothetical protein
MATWGVAASTRAVARTLNQPSRLPVIGQPRLTPALSGGWGAACMEAVALATVTGNCYRRNGLKTLTTTGFT